MTSRRPRALGSYKLPKDGVLAPGFVSAGNPYTPVNNRILISSTHFHSRL